MFTASRPFLLFDYLRVPYTLSESEGAETGERDGPLRRCGHLARTDGSTGSDRSLWWLDLSAGTAAFDSDLALGEYRLESIPLHGTIAPDPLVREWLCAAPGAWEPTTAILDAGGNPVSSIWKSDQGGVFLPFDPGQVMEWSWSERYHGARDLLGLTTRIKKVAVLAYYAIRPVLPRSTQIFLRRRLSRIQARSRFPRWPIETALHDLYAVLLREVAEFAETPIPWIAPWPSGHSWALVLTHDVETERGYRELGTVREVEERLGYRSSWNFVPKRYEVADSVVEELTAGGFEVGVHGLYHDGRDIDLVRERLSEIRSYAERWGASGFRSPATRRIWEHMPVLGFDYDTSYPDTDPFEPDAGGCCTWLPFFNEDLVELPTTLPQDHTLFAILRRVDASTWIDKTSFLRERGGMALMLVHPDYVLEPEPLAVYREFLAAFADDPTAWRALPRDVSAWWRRRASSRLELDSGEWRIIGPAAGEGDIRFFAGTEAAV
jgi:hypothetical protein